MITPVINQGKWPSSYGSVAVISLQNMRSLLKAELQRNLNIASISYYKTLDMSSQFPLQAIDSLAMQYLLISKNHKAMYTSSSSVDT